MRQYLNHLPYCLLSSHLLRFGCGKDAVKLLRDRKGCPADAACDVLNVARNVPFRFGLLEQCFEQFAGGGGIGLSIELSAEEVF